MFEEKVFGRFSLKIQLLMIFLFLLCVLVVLLSMIYLSSERVLIGKVMENIDNITKALQVSVEKLTSEEEANKSVKKSLEEWSKSGIREISLVTENSKIIASSNEKKVGKYMNLPKQKGLLIRAGFDRKQDNKIYQILMPVSVKGHNVGYVYMTIDLDEYRAFQRRNHIKRIVSMILAFAFGIVLSFIIAKRYTDPIKKIAMISKKIANGELLKINETERKDEIGVLIRSFNEMVEKLAEQKRLEEKLKESEKFSTIAQISSGMAHEIRNPLNFLSLSIGHIKEKIVEKGLDKHGEILPLLDENLKEIKKVNMLIHNFLLLGKEPILNRDWINIETFLLGTIQSLKDRIKEGIEINLNGEKSAMMFCDREYMNMCLTNLLLNAIESINEKGKIEITWGEKDGYSFISVADTGEGIEEKHISKIFEPYYTTKKFGIGIGLTMTKKFVEAHGGTISVESKRFEGTKVTIEVPNGK